MQVLDNAVVRDHYDVIVVGAGIGGLTTAALLAKRGLDVLVVEQHSLPGGCCSAVRRQDVAMDVGSTVLYGFGEQGLNAHRFVMNELGEDIDVIARESIFRLHIGKRTITFWRDFDRFLAEVVAFFPHQEAELRRFFKYGLEVYKQTILQSEYIVPPTEVAPELMIELFGKTPMMAELLRWQGKTGLELFESFFTDPELIAFFDMLTRVFSYVDAKECPALLSLTMFSDNHVGGAYYPAGSPQMLPNKLENAIERFGGQMLYRQTVDEIVIERGCAKGVRLLDGKLISADRVVANATIWNLYGKLVKPEHITKKRLEWAKGFKPSHSNVILYIQLDREVLSDNLQPIEVIVEDPTKIVGHGITIYLSSLIDPSLSPSDLCSVTVTYATSLKWPSPTDPEYRSEAYQQMKEEEAKRAIRRVETLIPGFGAAIRGMEIATPATLERFTLRNWGTVGGPKQAIGQDMMNRPSARTEFRHLYMVGDSTVMGIGVLPATISAVGCANAVLKELGEPLYVRRDFEKQHIHIAPGKPLLPRIARDEPITHPAQAIRLARDCNHCEKPACVAACPASIDLVGFLRRVEAGNFEGAAQQMREMNPLAETCGTACPSERYCEAACIHNAIDGRPVEISKIHGYVCGAVTGGPTLPTADEERPQRIAVVGTGPAGLSCAHFLGRLGYQVDMFDRSTRLGGMLSHAVDPESVSESTLMRELNVIDYPTVALHLGKTLGEDLHLAALEHKYDAVFLAPGLWKGRTLDLPGSKDAWTCDALSFLKQRRAAASGDTDAKLRVGKSVVVVGGGSVAFDAATAAQDAGAAQVVVTCLETESEMPMLRSELTRLKARGIRIEAGWSPAAVVGLTVELTACTRVRDEAGAFAPQLDPSRTLTLEADQVIWAVGQAAEPGLSRHLETNLSCSLPLRVDPESQRLLGRSKIYAGGDIVRSAGTIVEAVADGRRAARAMHDGFQAPLQAVRS